MYDPNSKRSLRQKKGGLLVKKAFVAHGGGMVVWPPGVGKTRLSIHEIAIPMLKVFPEAKVEVLVGTSALLAQWTEKIQQAGIAESTSINTWQSVYNAPTKSKPCKLLIVDEAHTILSTDKYSRVRQVYAPKWTLLLTATPRDSDLEALRLMWKFPVVDRISLSDALKNKFVSTRLEYNLPVPLPFEDSLEYKENSEKIRKFLIYLDPTVPNPDDYSDRLNFKAADQILLKKYKMGYVALDGSVFKNTSKTFYLANKHNIKHYNEGIRKGKPYIRYSYPFAEEVAKMRMTTPNIIIGMARRCNELATKNIEIVYGNPNKLHQVLMFLRQVKGKGFIFANRTKDCDKICELDAELLKPYHGKAGTDKKLKSYAEQFTNDEIRALVSIRKIEAGSDFPNVSFAVNHSYYSKWSSYEQRCGRATREEQANPNKKAIILNLYSTLHQAHGFEDTQEKAWIIKAQKNSLDVNWINKLETINFDI